MSAAPLSALVVDDEPLARDELVYLLGQSGAVEVVGEAASGDEALRRLPLLRPNVLFLDVQMPGMGGFQVAERVLALPQPPHVVFVTAFDQYAVQAFELHAVDYLMKPVEPARLHRTLMHVQRQQGQVQLLERLEGFLSRVEGRRIHRLPLERAGRMVLVSPEEVLFAASSESGCMVRVGEEEYTTPFTLQDLENRLGREAFFRVHRQYLVNLAKVREFVPWFNGTAALVLADKARSQVPVSRSQVKPLKELLGM